jgi:ribonuclease PH
MFDADVIQADGGTRTASITGCFIVLKSVIKQLMDEGKIDEDPVAEFMAAISVGMKYGEVLLDLPYLEDSTAEVDMNVVMTESGKFIEVQGTAETAPFTKKQLDSMLEVAQKGIMELISLQKQALK